MDKKSFVLGFILAVILVSIISSAYFYTLDTDCYVHPVFSPDSEQEIISLINNAQESIDIEMYVFTNENLIDALADARERGVDVRVILEGEIEDNTNAFYELSLKGIQVKWAPRDFSRTHSKFMIIDKGTDREKVFVGSTNFSFHAVTSNREASVVINCNVQDFVLIFEQDWKNA